VPTPRIHSLRALALMALTALLVTLLAPASLAATWQVPTTRTDETATSLDDYEDQLMVEVNRAREANGVRPIRAFDGCTDLMAQRWSRRIARTGVFEHRNQSQVLRRCRASWAGENLVRGAEMAPEDMVQAWLDSPGHRRILLSKRARFAGVGVSQDAQGRLVGVLNVVRKR
jgi:uncharacterized protein YkwD